MAKDVTPLHAAALAWAARGVPVFPCCVGSKKPLPGSRGFLDATTDIAQIDAWWREDPLRNVAIYPGGAREELAIIDTDPPAGEAGWTALESEHGHAPETYTVRTPRGGRHRYFLGSLPPSTSKLAPNVDTRGQGSYVLVAPSRTADGTYTEEKAVAFAKLPVWVPAGLSARERAHVAARGVTLDLLPNVARARSYLKTAPASVEGSGGDQNAYRVACQVLDFGLSPERGLELAMEPGGWNDRCEPPWDEWELGTKFANASAYAQNEAGAWAVRPAAEVFGPVLDLQPAKCSERRRFKLIFPRDMRELPVPSYVVDRLIPDQAVTLIYGAPASLKTFIVLDLLASTALGVPAFKRFRTRPGLAILCAGEGPITLAQRRWPAFAQARGVEDPDQAPFAIVPAVPLVSDPSQVKELIAEIEASGSKPRLIAVDTVARAVGGQDENDARAAGLMIGAADELREAFGCSVILVHHSGKDETKGARGSSALAAGADAIFHVIRAKDTLAVTLRCEKMKDADEPEDVHLMGEPVGASLAFHAVSADEHVATTRANPPLSAKEVSAALQAAGAIDGNEITTHALAVQLCDGQGENEKAVKNMAKRLRDASEARLAAFVAAPGDGRGSVIKWTFPTLEPGAK